MVRRLGLVLCALLVVASCKARPPKPGSPCRSNGDMVCGDDTTRFVCTSGKWAIEHCTACAQSKGFGSKSSFYAGCVAGGIGPEGATCDGDTRDCDGNVLVKCMDGAYRRFTCGGAGGCSHQTDGVHCDSSVASAGEACLHEDDSSCTADHKAVLHCSGGRFVVEKTCGGPKGCVTTTKDKDTITISCDASVGKLGDPCLKGAACSADKTSILKCDAGKYVVMSRCRGAVAECTFDEKDERVECAEPTTGEAGDPCDSGGRCSADGKALLVCKDGVLVVKDKCRTCKPEPGGEKITCKF